jgi:1-acyl-sn-glycerol-3-phosphate acyltransferase
MASCKRAWECAGTASVEPRAPSGPPPLGVRRNIFLPCSLSRPPAQRRYACTGTRVGSVHKLQGQSAYSSRVRAAPLRLARAGLQIIVGLIVFGVLCLAWSAIALPLLLLPARWGRRIGRLGISAGFRLYFWATRASRVFHFDGAALSALSEGPPVVLAPNHPGLLDALVIVARQPRVCCVLKAQLLNNLFLGAGARLAGYIRHDPPRRMIRSALTELARGGIVLLFPEGTRTTQPPLNPLQAGVGIIAKQAQVAVQTLIIETDSSYGSKGTSLLRIPDLPIHYRIRLGRRFDPPEDVRAFMAELDRYFRHTLGGASPQRRRACMQQAQDAGGSRRSSHTA